MNPLFKKSYRAALSEIMASPEALSPEPKITKQNQKLNGDNIAVFSLIAGINCPGAGGCNGSSYCYAQHNRYTWPQSMKRRVLNYLASQREEFVEQMLVLLNRNRANIQYFRWHDSGDFYAQAYIRKVSEICNEFKSIQFYAYTKSLHLDLKPLENLRNFNIIQSVGGRYDHLIDYSKPHSKIFRSHQALIDSGYADASESDLPAAMGETRIGLVIHGNGRRNF